MKISTNQFKNGTKLIIDGSPCSIINHEFHKPGKGQAVMRVKYKNLLSGNTNEKTFKSGESAELADVQDKELIYEMVDFHSSRPGHDLRYALNGDKMKEMGWVPSDIRKRIQEVVKWTLDNKRWLAE